MMPPVKMFYDGRIEDLPQHLENMGAMFRTNTNIPLHSLTVVLKNEEVSFLGSLQEKGRKEGYHVISIEGDLYEDRDFDDFDEFRGDKLKWPFNSNGNSYTLIF